MLKQMKKIIFLIFFLTAFTYSQKTRVAVLDFTGSQITESEALIFTDIFKNNLTETMSFEVLNKTDMEKLLEDQPPHIWPCDSLECVMQMGKLFKVGIIFFGILTKDQDNYILNVDMINVETGKIDRLFLKMNQTINTSGFNNWKLKEAFRELVNVFAGMTTRSPEMVYKAKEKDDLLTKSNSSEQFVLTSSGIDLIKNEFKKSKKLFLRGRRLTVIGLSLSLVGIIPLVFAIDHPLFIPLLISEIISGSCFLIGLPLMGAQAGKLDKMAKEINPNNYNYSGKKGWPYYIVGWLTSLSLYGMGIGHLIAFIRFNKRGNFAIDEITKRKRLSILDFNIGYKNKSFLLSMTFGY